jgi:tetratricopeptide (TPR) repeat protein
MSSTPFVTTTLGTSPEIAVKIIHGLNPPNPIYERIGGVIRRVDNKQIVTWLRDVNMQGVDPAAIHKFGPLLQLNAATSLLNLSVTAVGFAVVMQRLNLIERKLDAISKELKEINRKLDLSFYANFQAALELARSAFAMQDETNRRISATQAINRFLEAEHHYLSLLDTELEAGTSAIFPFFSTLILAYMSVAHCYIEMGEIQTARRHLQEGSQTLTERLENFYDMLIGVNPAIYLHPKLANIITLERMTQVMRYRNPTLTESEAFEELRQLLWETSTTNPDLWLKKLPVSLWNSDVDGKVKKVIPISRKPKGKIENLLLRLPEAFAQVEQAIETVGCVNGYQIELDYLLANNFNFDDWQNIEIPYFSKSDPIVLVIPEESELAALAH